MDELREKIQIGNGRRFGFLRISAEGAGYIIEAQRIRARRVLQGHDIRHNPLIRMRPHIVDKRFQRFSRRAGAGGGVHGDNIAGALYQRLDLFERGRNVNRAVGIVRFY